MSKLYVPDGAWLVCSNGMKKQQIKVTSQSSVTIAGSHLKATVDDRPGGNFICGKMALAGAIIGAAVGVALVAGTILTGGALAVAACAAAGAAAGVGVSLIPSICGMLLKEWLPFDVNVTTAGKAPLLENSQIPCLLGGNVMILYSEKAANEFTDLTLGKTAIDVIGVVALSYLLYPALAAIGSTAVTVKSTIATFGWAAGMNYLGGIGVSTGVAYGVGFGIDQAKGGVYSTIPTGDGNTIKDYVDGFETNPEKLVQNHNLLNSDGNKGVEEHANDLGGATGVGKETIGNRSSEYITRDRTTSVRLDDIEEHGVTSRNEIGRLPNAIEGKNPNTVNTQNVIDEDFGGRYQEIERTSTKSNSQYAKNDLSLKGSGNIALNSGLNALKDNFGKPQLNSTKGVEGGGLYIGLLQDAYKGITNFILKDQAEDLLNALQNEESEARAKISVLAGKD